MTKIVIDTNVLISALIQRSYPYLILDAVLFDVNFEICLSTELFEEYIEVLHRKKFSKYPDFISRAHLLLADLELRGKLYRPTTTVTLIKDDDDNMLLELAEESKADYLITGNTNDFSITAYKRTKILSPKEFWEKVFIK